VDEHVEQLQNIFYIRPVGHSTRYASAENSINLHGALFTNLGTVDERAELLQNIFN
jgi:hypothetical protein